MVKRRKRRNQNIKSTEAEKKGEKRKRYNGLYPLSFFAWPFRCIYEYVIKTGKIPSEPYAQDVPLVNVFYKDDCASVVAYLPFKFKDKPRIEVRDGILSINVDTTKGKIGKEIPIPKDLEIESTSLRRETLIIELGKRSKKAS